MRRGGRALRPRVLTGTPRGLCSRAGGGRRIPDKTAFPDPVCVLHEIRAAGQSTGSGVLYRGSQARAEPRRIRAPEGTAPGHARAHPSCPQPGPREQPCSGGRGVSEGRATQRGGAGVLAVSRRGETQGGRAGEHGSHGAPEGQAEPGDKAPALSGEGRAGGGQRRAAWPPRAWGACLVRGGLPELCL